jgi:hypothetical protein
MYVGMDVGNNNTDVSRVVFHPLAYRPSLIFLHSLFVKKSEVCTKNVFTIVKNVRAYM